MEPVYSWPAVVGVSLLLLGVVGVTYPPRVKHLASRWRRLLIGMRFVTAIVLILAMLRPAIRYTDVDKQPAELIVLLDSSRSMNTADSTQGRTRREELIQLMQSKDEQLQKLAEEVDVRFIDFAEMLSPTDEPTPEAEGKATAIGKILDEIRREESTKRLAGILLMSDGAQRAIGEDDIDPRSVARRFAEQKGIPVYTVTFGSAELSGSGIDLAVEDVLVDTYPYEKQTVRVRFQLRAIGASGRKVRVRLLKEGTNGEEELIEVSRSEGIGIEPTQEIEVKGNRITKEVELSFVALRPGEQKIAVEVIPETGEAQTRNNRYETLITVQKGGLKVAYFDVARPEFEKLKRMNDGQSKLQIDWNLLPAGKFIDSARIDARYFEPEAYDVYIIGDIPARVFSQGGEDLLIQLATRCNEGAGLMMIGGAYNFGSGGYAETPIAPFLPVRMTPGERRDPGEPPAPELFIETPVQFLPGPDGRNHFITDLGTGGTERWLELPLLKDGANRFVPLNDRIANLGWSADEEPLMLGWDTGRARVLALGVSDTWRWWSHGHEEAFRRFWEQTILWLARKEFDSDRPIWVRVNPRNFTPGNKVPIEIGVQDDNRNPISGAQLNVTVTEPDSSKVTVPFQQIDSQYLSSFSDSQEPGDYSIEVTATKDGVPLGGAAFTRFIIDPRDLELDNPAADPDLMAEIATLTGGIPIAPAEFGDFLDTLLEEGFSTEVERHRQVNLWDNWPLLLAFIGLLTVEWFLRKRAGLV